MAPKSRQTTRKQQDFALASPLGPAVPSQLSGSDEGKNVLSPTIRASSPPTRGSGGGVTMPQRVVPRPAHVDASGALTSPGTDRRSQHASPTGSRQGGSGALASRPRAGGTRERSVSQSPRSPLSTGRLSRSSSANHLVTPREASRPRRGSQASSVASSPQFQSGDSHNVKVMVRVRPFTQDELESRAQGEYMQSVVDMPRTDQVRLLDPRKGYEATKAYNFDFAMWSCTQQESPVGMSSQEDVYDETGAPALEASWEGMNSCIFAYGQTGSGKTHTMMGDPGEIASEEGCSPAGLGVIPRLCRRLFDEKERQGKSTLVGTGMHKAIDVEVSFIEIYNEKCYDLLAGCDLCERQTDTRPPRTGAESPTTEMSRPAWDRSVARGQTQPRRQDELRVREHPTEGPQVYGASRFLPRSHEEVLGLINFGNQQRSTAATQLNDRSSRSHAMFRITLRQRTLFERARPGIGDPQIESTERRSNLNLVDLAGSEDLKRSGAVGGRLVEARNINLSLTTLRRVIDALIERANRRSKQVVPYRDSTLTWLLRENLGGNSKCFMLATVSPHLSNVHETQRTLEYATLARAIVNKVVVNEDETSKILRELRERLEREHVADLGLSTSSEAYGQLQAELAMREQELQQRIQQFERDQDAYKEQRDAEAASAERAALSEIAQLKDELADANRRLKAAQQKLRELQDKRIRAVQDSEMRLQQEVEELRAENAQLRSQKDEAKAAQRTAEEQATWARQEADDHRSAAEAHTAELAAIRQQVAEASGNKPELVRLQRQAEEAEVHAAEMHAAETERLREQLDAARRDASERRREAEGAAAQLSAMTAQTEELHGRALEHKREAEVRASDAARLREQLHRAASESASHRDSYDRAAAELERVRRQLQAALDEAGAQLQAARDDAAEQRAAADAASRQAAQLRAQMQDELSLQRAYRNISEFLDYVGQDKVPAHWAMADVRQLFSAFASYRRAVVSHKPLFAQYGEGMRSAAAAVRPVMRGSFNADTPRQVLTAADHVPLSPARRRRSVRKFERVGSSNGTDGPPADAAPPRPPADRRAGSARAQFSSPPTRDQPAPKGSHRTREKPRRPTGRSGSPLPHAEAAGRGQVRGAVRCRSAEKRKQRGVSYSPGLPPRAAPTSEPQLPE